MKFLGTLREGDIKDLAKDRNVPASLQGMAKKFLEKKNQPKKDEK
ncbi:MAG TPA: hypothetical protein VLQ93_20990 [Myxococcaceae bacterium]|nr:hypothetical protein [Myxococcaceae bacterium]